MSKKLLDYVNCKMGTDSLPRYSHGNTLPLTQQPFGMAAFAPQTTGSVPGGEKARWWYHPTHRWAEGIRLTHQPSPWIYDYGTFLMTPQNDVIADTPQGAWSGVRPENSVLRPDGLKVHFLRSEITFELTPTQRGGLLRLTRQDDRPAVLTLFPVLGNYTYAWDGENATLLGTTDGHSDDAARDFKMYFALRFPQDTPCPAIFGEGVTCGAHVPLEQKVTEISLGISYLSHEMAVANLERECGGYTFDTLREENDALWESMLRRLAFTPKDEEQAKTFYSCLWRTFLYPHKAYEKDKNGQPVHYSPFDGKCHPGVRYTDNGFWDTYRTVYPLFALVAREEYAEMLEGFIVDYEEGGWLPRWPSIGEVGCMPSTLIDAVIADAAVKGIGTPALWERGLQGMLHHANYAAPEARYGRNGVLSYLELGYVPREEEKESVNLTQDAAYGDWCIAQVARVLGKTDLVEEYEKRGQNYRHIFDPATGFMRGKDRQGNMAENFDPLTWGGEYTEGSAWQNSFAVPHDIEGLAELHGGKEALVKKLDELFATPPRYRVFGYGNEIHEMTEMAGVDFGQCAISNQPSFHLPFLYAALGHPEKARYWVEKLLTAFSSGDDGYPGDEDNGTMSAWYIFATLGFYPLCPGKNEYVRI